MINDKLNQIKSNWEWYNSNDNLLYGMSELLSNDDIEYLIKQAEEKERLEMENKKYINYLSTLLNGKHVSKDVFKDIIINKAILDLKELMNKNE